MIATGRLLLAVISGVLFLPHHRSFAAAPTTMNYRGFTINVAKLRSSPELDQIQAAIREQIDLVCAVGVPAEALTFFQSVPFVVLPAGTIPRSTPGLYVSRDRSVNVISNIITVGHKPVLLHELLHAYHDQRLKDGFRNREVLAHYARAKHIAAYSQTSHMMQNDREYFACMATTFLFGVTAQEPFQREKLRTNQPEVVDYLQKIFGPNSGEFAGSLQR